MEAQIIPILNPLEQYQVVSEELKEMRARKDALREQIFDLMDRARTDTLTIGGYRASRSLIVQDRLNTRHLKEYLGSQYKDFVSETPVIRLNVLWG